MSSPRTASAICVDATSSGASAFRLAMNMIWNWRLKRWMIVGPRPRRSSAMLSMRTGPRAEGTVSLPTVARSRRWLSSTRIFTGYCSVPSR